MGREREMSELKYYFDIQRVIGLFGLIACTARAREHHLIYSIYPFCKSVLGRHQQNPPAFVSILAKNI
jgi:hypothetical protein